MLTLPSDAIRRQLQWRFAIDSTRKARVTKATLGVTAATIGNPCEIFLAMAFIHEKLLELLPRKIPHLLPTLAALNDQTKTESFTLLVMGLQLKADRTE